MNHDDLDLEKLSLLAEVASMYYEQNLTQSEIAARIYSSRSKVSRLLTRAKERGVVEVKIHYPGERVYEIENQLKRIYGIEEVQVLYSCGRSYSEILRALGIMTAEYLDNELKDNMTLGVTWGRTLYHAAEALAPKKKNNLLVTQIFGAAGTESPVIDTVDLVRKIASVYSGRHRYIHSPLYVLNDVVRESLLLDPYISETLDLARKADIILTGIGSLHPFVSSSLVTRHLSPETIEDLRNSGAVGHLCACFFDEKGDVLDINLNKTIIGISIAEMCQAGKVIAVAGGETKAKAILGCLRKRYVNVLITDDTAARRVLELEAKIGHD